MGCDIHGMFERKHKSEYKDCSWWVNAGDPDIDRDYNLFSILGGVRNDNNILPIAHNRILSDDIMNSNCCSTFCALVEDWMADGHSHSFVTLPELKDNQIRGSKLSDQYILLINYGDNIRHYHGLRSEDIRYCFFFDN